jgi:hypothetical protein
MHCDNIAAAQAVHDTGIIIAIRREQIFKN